MRPRVLLAFVACTFLVLSCTTPDYRGWKCKLDQDCFDTSSYVCSSITRTCARRLVNGERSCQTAHDCAEGHVCDAQTQTCLLPDGAGAIPAGGPCKTALDCEAPLGCYPEPQHGELRCGRASGVAAICRDASDCQAPLQCAEHTCRAPLGTPCASAAECPADAACRPDDAKLLRCQPKAQEGAVCASPGDCARGSCSPATLRCPGKTGMSCLSEQDCLSPNVCAPVGNERLCAPAVGACGRCDTDSDCASGLCRSGLCTSTRAGTCTSDACCPVGHVCVPDGTSALICQPIGTTPGASCLLDAHCATGLGCWEGRECRYKIGKGPCKAASDCVGTPPVCLIGQCVEPAGEKAPCVEPDGTAVPAACKPGLLCGVTVCVSPGSLPEGARCRNDLECNPALSCVGGYCKH